MTALDPLAVLLGDWHMTAQWGDDPPIEGGRMLFEWMPGRRFLIQRWEIPLPEAPDGIALIGADPEREGAFLQHYFDTRGVARVYRMTLADGLWRLQRDTPDFSPLDFAQRYVGGFEDDGRTIAGAWEICHDGTTWEHDFDLSYTRAESD